jgi:hypothetical protein
MNLYDLIAIDIHLHAMISSRHPDDEVGRAFARRAG